MLGQPRRAAACAICSGEAPSERVSISRDLLMSQFWQNLQARLQPAVPNDSTGVPGRKWFRSDLLGRGAVGEGVDLSRLADVPVLAELAGQVAAGGAERQHRGAGQEMVQRLLLDRIDAVAARPAVGLEHDLAALAGAHETEAALSLEQLAGPRAEIALDTPLLKPVVEAVPVLRRHRVSPRCGKWNVHTS